MLINQPTNQPTNYGSNFIRLGRQVGGPKFDIFGLICKLQVSKVQNRIKNSFLEIQLLDMLTPQNLQVYQTSDISPETFRSINQRLALLQKNLENGAKSWSVKYRMPYKMCNRSRDFIKFTGRCYVINI